MQRYTFRWDVKSGTATSILAYPPHSGSTDTAVSRWVLMVVLARFAVIRGECYDWPWPGCGSAGKVWRGRLTSWRHGVPDRGRTADSWLRRARTRWRCRHRRGDDQLRGSGLRRADHASGRSGTHR